MNNVLIGLLLLVVTFTLLLIVEKLFKKEGLYAWISMALIAANILECKTIPLLSLTSTCGNILFASIFLATDIMTEKYGSKYAKNAIKISVFTMIAFIIIMQIGLLFKPDVTDFAHDSMKTLLGLNLRISVASIIMFYISNNLDIYIFDKLRKKLPDKLWLRNNVATIVSNVSENYLFILLAFTGIYDFKTMIIIASSISIVEIIIALLDTPFIYLSKKLN